MTARGFMQVGIGVFLLVAAYQLGASRAGAAYVDQTSHPVATLNAHGLVLTSSGEVYIPGRGDCGGGQRWIRNDPAQDPPIPVSQIKFWDNLTIVANDGSVFTWTDASSAVGCEGMWVQMPPLPGTVAVEPTTMGEMKGKYKEK